MRDFAHAELKTITDSTGTEVWNATSQKPFGLASVDEDPDGDSIDFKLNIRLPGQYYDVEAGHHYNYFRDYYPGVGRYLQADPIGLKGGINLYGYVGGDPVNEDDPMGLWFGADDLITGPVDEIIVLGGLSILAMAGNEWAKDVLDSLSDAISDALSNDTSEDNECRDPCKGLRKQLQKHQDKLRRYIKDPFSMDNNSFLNNTYQERMKKIFSTRINNLTKQINNFKRQLEECERKYGLK